MITLRQVGEWILSAKEHSTSVSPDRSAVYSFDLEGRPLSWFAAGRVYKRSLSSVVVGRERLGGSRTHWEEPRERAAELFAGLLEAVARAPRAGLDEPLLGRLDGILRWTPETLLAERSRFDAAYRPVSILPPDQYLSVVLQATFGCSWNRCTFCSFYHDEPFRARGPAEFREHCDRVATLLGRSAKLRPRIFLAGGNALVLANERLRPLFRDARDVFPGRPFGGFVDVYSGERKSAGDWAELCDLGLESVCVGLETGDDDLLSWLNKPGSAAEARAFVGALKKAGLRVALVLMVGVGGRRFAEQHVTRTLDLAASLPLGDGDIVYLSPFREQKDSAYAARAATEGVEPLDGGEQARQYRALRDGLRASQPGVRVTRYDIREFVY
jgi:radical SAM superfamily enzyme YgiQ (UPF0313 family)